MKIDHPMKIDPPMKIDLMKIDHPMKIDPMKIDRSKIDPDVGDVGNKFTFSFTAALHIVQQMEAEHSLSLHLSRSLSLASLSTAIAHTRESFKDFRYQWKGNTQEPH